MQSRGGEQESSCAALCHLIERLVAAWILARRIGEEHVVADCTYTGAVERIEEIRVALPAPGPAAFAARAEIFDRAFVDLDHRHASRGRGLERTPLHGEIEDRVLGGIERLRVRPVPGEPGDRGEGEQRIEREPEL